MQLFSGPGKPRMLFFLRVNVKMPTIVGILTLMSRKNFMLTCVEHEKSFITSGPGVFLRPAHFNVFACFENGIYACFIQVATKTGFTVYETS